MDISKVETAATRAAENLRRVVIRNLEGDLDCLVASVRPDATSLKLTVELKVDGVFEKRSELSWRAPDE